METGSFEDNDRLRKEIALLIKKDLDQQLEIARFERELVFAWSQGYETGINDPKGGHAPNPYTNMRSI